MLELKGVCKSYGKTEVLKSLNLRVDDGEIVCLLGPSGCGKSTILNLISGLVNQDRGAVEIGTEKLGYVFQEDRLLPWRTVYQNIAIVRDDESLVMELIEEVELYEFRDSYPEELSGGMRQRCSIARAFNSRPELLLMDEPFKSLDYNLRIKMVDYLLKLWKKNRSSVVFVTHEIDEALLLGDRVVVFSDRPSFVKLNMKIGMPQQKRKLNSEKIVQARSRIIEELLN